jgi:hypothetical protein
MDCIVGIWIAIDVSLLRALLHTWHILCRGLRRVPIHERFAPVRNVAAPYTQEEIDAAIDEAVRAVHGQHAQRGH